MEITGALLTPSVNSNVKDVVPSAWFSCNRFPAISRTPFNAVLSTVIDNINVHETSHVVYLGRPTDPMTRDKWLVCVFRFSASVPVDRRAELLHYVLGLVDGYLIAHLTKGD